MGKVLVTLRVTQVRHAERDEYFPHAVQLFSRLRLSNPLCFPAQRKAGPGERLARTRFALRIMVQKHLHFKS
jgi:hypothetical protein